MSTQKTLTDQVTISLHPDGSVRGINVYAGLFTYDDAGAFLGAVALPVRDATADDVANLLDPSLVVQQGQIATLTAAQAQAKADAQTAADQAAQILAAAQAAQKAAEDDATAKQAQIETLKAQLAAATAPPAVPTQNAAQKAAAAVFEALPAGKQALWESVRAAVDAKLATGDLAGAREIIATVPVIYEGMEADRAAFLALFPAPAPQG